MKCLLNIIVILASIHLSACVQSSGYPEQHQYARYEQQPYARYASNITPKAKTNAVAGQPLDPAHEPLASTDEMSGKMLAYHRRYGYRYGAGHKYGDGDNDGVGRYSMDSADKSKLHHALDNPIGKATTWINETTNVTYTVVPTKKVTIGGNPFCREYRLTEKRGSGSTRESYGTACVDTKSSKWQAARTEQPRPQRQEWQQRRSGWPWSWSQQPTYSDY